MGWRADIAEEIIMAKATVYYFTFFDKAKGETVRPRRPGTLEAIAKTRMASVRPLVSTAWEVEESALDKHGFYLGPYRSLQDV
jgi:hypothetical protein